MKVNEAGEKRRELKRMPQELEKLTVCFIGINMLKKRNGIRQERKVTVMK